MKEKLPQKTSVDERFYLRLSFYRLLEARWTDLSEAAKTLGVGVKTLRRWKKAYDPGRGPFGLIETGGDACPTNLKRGERGEILDAMRQQALEGNVPAAKLLLAEYEEQPATGEEVLTVERAIELLREWAGNETTTKTA